MLPFRDIALLAFDIDGTLTDGTTWWASDDTGWVQRFCVRDGEALQRLAERIPVVPLSSNDTPGARQRMQMLGLDTRWIAVEDKLAALREICDKFSVSPDRACFVGDGLEDASVMHAVGLGCAVHDAHVLARDAAHVVLASTGGDRVIEEIENRMSGRH
jgi:3-deoxy-D-manno-octulosonate 8-phosphate phosphatase (KDO 8-P phosphatase)